MSLVGDFHFVLFVRSSHNKYFITTAMKRRWRLIKKIYMTCKQCLILLASRKVSLCLRYLINNVSLITLNCVIIFENYEIIICDKKFLRCAKNCMFHNFNHSVVGLLNTEKNCNKIITSSTKNNEKTFHNVYAPSYELKVIKVHSIIIYFVARWWVSWGVDDEKRQIKSKPEKLKFHPKSGQF